MHKVCIEVVSSEVLWFAVCIDAPVIGAIVSDAVKNEARKLIAATNHLLQMLATANKDADFEAFPSIDGYLASQHKDLQKYGHLPSVSQTPPNYTKLTVTVIEADTFGVKQLMHDLRSYYPKYVKFEKSLVACFYNEIAETLKQEEEAKGTSKKAGKK
jgi:hypothetical protein